MKVSVAMITYNHERFIAQALDSILMQRVDFTYEIVVGEDCSTDTTREILLGYQKKYPEKIRLLLPDKNLGMMVNFVATLSECRGDYIALLEGDDYWTSPDKLQKQVNLLDAHPECSACFHNVLTVHEGDSQKEYLFHKRSLAKRFFDLKDIVSSHFIPTCSTVFRARLYDAFPPWFLDMPMGDWPLHILNAEHGSYVYIDEVLAAYRIHGGGTWSSRSRLAVLESTVVVCQCIDNYFAGRFSREIDKLTRILEIQIAELLIKQQQIDQAARRLFKTYRLSLTLFSRTLRCTRRLLLAWIKHSCSSRCNKTG